MLKPGDRVIVKDTSFSTTWDKERKCYSHKTANVYQQEVTVVQSGLKLPGEVFLGAYYPNDTIICTDDGRVCFIRECFLKRAAISAGDKVVIKPGFQSSVFTVDSVDSDGIVRIWIHSDNVDKAE